ncbi:MAG: amidohydrolase family protein [Trueperaceae bacterium]
MRRLEGTLVLPDGLARGAIVYDDVGDGDSGGRITDVEVFERVADPFGASSAGVVDEVEPSGARAVAEPPFVLPGFVDGHVHGGGGADTMDGAEGVRTMARFHLHRGTTTLLPTTITNPWENVVAALAAVAEVAHEARAAHGRRSAGEGRVAHGGRAAQEGHASAAPLPSIPGAHLEGPFISPQRLGAQPPFTLEPAADRVAELLEMDIVRVVTLAPEIPHAAEAAETFARAGVRVSFGHTVADAEQVAAVAQRVRSVGGTVGFTHLFNAMSQLVGRAPGVVGAALADEAAFAELILDFHHVHPTSFLAALAAKPQRLSLITDAIRACGAGEGESELGGVPVRVEGGTARLADGTLAGSVLTLDQAVRNATAIGVPLHVASRLASSVPASYLGLADRGALTAGLRADVVVLDGDLQVLEVVVGGLGVPVGPAPSTTTP